MKRVAAIGLVIGLLIAASGTYFLMSARGRAVREDLQETGAKLIEMTGLRDAANSKISDL